MLIININIPGSMSAGVGRVQPLPGSVATMLAGLWCSVMRLAGYCKNSANSEVVQFYVDGGDDINFQ